MTKDQAEWEHVNLEGLLEDGRYEEAEELLAQIPRHAPDGAWALSLRAICLAELKRDTEALALARQAVDREPESAFSLWTLSALLCDRDRLTEAMVVAHKVVDVDPTSAMPHALIAQIHAKRKEWPQARAAAERGLSLDPSDQTCSNLRALSLRATESGDEWSAAIENLVHTYPASGWARAGRGWSLLEAGRAHEAKENFEQALALDPTSEWAREGLIESIKAKNPVYSSLLRLFLWLDRLPPRTRWMIILGGIFLYRILRRSTEGNPSLAPLTYPLMAAWLLFIVASWTSTALSDFVLSRSDVGKPLVRGERLAAANMIAGLLGAALVLGVVAMISGSERAVVGAMSAGFLIIPVAGTFRCSPGWPRTVMTVYTSIAFVAALAATVTPPETSRLALVTVILLSVLGSWIATFLASRRPAR